MEEKLMPDFDTRKPQGSDEPNSPRIQSIANRLSSLLTASKPRLLSMASTVRDSLIANRLRSLLIGGVLLFVIAAVPVGLLLYSVSGPGDQRSVSGLGDWQLGDRRLVYEFDGYLWTINPNGSNLTRLPVLTWEELTVSPNGKRIAFDTNCPEASSSSASASASPRPGSFSCLYVVNTEGSDKRTLVNGFDQKKLLGDLPIQQPEWKPVWSPDSKKLAFTGWSNNPYTRCDIYVVNANGSGAPTRLSTQPHDCHSMSISSWSPDGKKIAGQVSNQMDVSQIYVFNVSGREAKDQALKLTEGPGSNSAPSWSPDGTEIVFTHIPDRKHCLGPNANYPEKYCFSSGVPAVYKMNTDGSEVTRLTHSPDVDFSPTWSPDGKKLAFVRQYSAGKSGIYTMNSDGSDLTLVRKFVATNTVHSVDW